MTLSELEAAIGWMERNRLSDPLHLLDGGPNRAIAEEDSLAENVQRAPLPAAFFVSVSVVKQRVRLCVLAAVRMRA